MSLKQRRNGSTAPAVQQSTDFFTDLSLLLTHAQPRERLIIRLLAETGMTPKELVSLKKTDLSADTRTLLLRAETTKHGLKRTLRLSTQLARSLAAHARTQAGTHLFSTRQSPQLSTRRVEQILKTTSTRAGTTPITARDLRNAYLAAAAAKAQDDDELRELTGLKTLTKSKALTQDEQRRLAKTLKKQPARDQALIRTLLETGKPLDETITLTRKDIATLTLTPQLTTLLRSLATKAEEPLFSTRQSDRLTRRRAEQIISSIGSKARLHLTSHRLRQTANSGGAP